MGAGCLLGARPPLEPTGEQNRRGLRVSQGWGEEGTGEIRSEGCSPLQWGLCEYWPSSQDKNTNLDDFAAQ